MGFLFAVGEILVTHHEIFEAILEAIEGGQSKATILANIKAGQAAASEAAVTADLGPRPRL